MFIMATVKFLLIFLETLTYVTLLLVYIWKKKKIVAVYQTFINSDNNNIYMLSVYPIFIDLKNLQHQSVAVYNE